ncbi:uncharacterized protein I206_104367 [Kwoniella pini CBS 10737]|uniref:C2H2-type domain-containing protein n=1 Tax=Kwoniella pini CBS 10737 TaxID=1296096 RepID=A0A1B9I1W0_9TREE|nr:uncharacterized protein I206_04054 [Kwoniella pini CBS 10737]OCF49533.1 hypothetical protein I206_04054 [Kwoniella pini CBS 10737]
MTPTPYTPQADRGPRYNTTKVTTLPSRQTSAVREEDADVGADYYTRIPQQTSMVRTQASITSSAHLQDKVFNQNIAFSPSELSPKATALSPTRKKMPVRRQSRFDPMAGENEEVLEDEGYGELGSKHPLRRVKEEENTKEGRASPPESISLPPIKSLFGVASDHSQTQSPSSSSLFQSPSLPSLISNSPSGSPSSARTSRYSSLTSSAVPENSAGWWAPDFEKGTSFFQPTPIRSSSHPTVPYIADQNDQKRRRSDGPPALRDAEESARLRWQAQSRNASYPMATSPQPPSAGPSNSNSSSSSGLRGLLHPPQASSAVVSASMSRSSLSGSATGGRLLPTLEDEPFPSSRRPSQASRNPSLVGGQLAGHFAGLTANDRNNSLSNELPPPLQSAPPERRGSQMLPPPLTSVEDNRTLFPPHSSLSRSASPASDILRRQSTTRPPSPDINSRPDIRRASLTEIIKQKSGDMPSPAVRFGDHGPPDLSIATSVSMDKSSLSEPVLPLHQHTTHSAPLWTNRRESVESVRSNHDPDDGHGQLPSLRGRKRSVDDTRQGRGIGAEDDEDTEMGNDPGMRGMEVLLAAAAVEEERKVRKSSEEDSMDEDGNFKSNVSTLNANGATGGANGGPKYTCAFCAKTFSRPSSLRIHTYSHTGERPYVCKEPTCRRRFSVQSNLKRHAKVHQLGPSALAQQQQQQHHLVHQQNGLPQHLTGHPAHPGLSRAPHSHSGALGPHGQTYFPPPPPNYYPHPPPHPHQHQQLPGYVPHPYNDRYAGPPGHDPHRGYGALPPQMGPPAPQAPGWQSVSSSRRTSKDDVYSDEGEEEEEEIDELEEDD